MKFQPADYGILTAYSSYATLRGDHVGAALLRSCAEEALTALATDNTYDANLVAREYGRTTYLLSQ